MKKNLFLGLLVCSVFMFSSCENDGLGKGLTGYYTDLSAVAKASDFNEINEAIKKNELLYVFDHRLGEDDYYYATRDLFLRDGMWWDCEHHHGRFRFHIKSTLYPVIHIIDKNTIAMKGSSCSLYQEGRGDGDVVYKFYAGPIFGNMEYVGYDWSYYTYTYIADNKIVVSNGDIYTIVDGSLIKDGSSTILSKYDPDKLHGAAGSSDKNPGNQGNVENGNGANDNNQEEKEVQEKISQNVVVNVSAYKNYSWDISITTSLESIYSNKTIKYGILCGYNNRPQYYYWKYFTLQGKSIKETVPLFVDGTGSPYVEHYMYWQSLVALAEKTSLTESEQMLKVSCIRYCNEVEDDALDEYWGQVFVEIDGEKYIVKEYGNKKQE